MTESERDIYWHKQCYNAIVHITRLDDKDRESEPSISKVRRQPFNWKQLCMFCERKSYNKDNCLINIVSDESCDTLEVKQRKTWIEVGTLNRKLIVYEAKYHKACR